MKFNIIYCLIFCIAISACKTQGQVFDLLSAKKGNTGNRGRIPKDEMQKPREGHDFYIFELKFKKQVTLELVSMLVNTEGKTYALIPTFEDKSKKTTIKTDETVFIYAQNDETATKNGSSPNSEAQLKLKMNGKLKKIDVKECQLILPQ